MTVASVALNCHIELDPSFDFDVAKNTTLEKSLEERVRKVGEFYLIDGALKLKESNDYLILSQDCFNQAQVIGMAALWHVGLWAIAALTLRWAFDLSLTTVSAIAIACGIKPLFSRLGAIRQWLDKTEKYKALEVPLMIAHMRKEGYELGFSFILEKSRYELYHPKELAYLFKKECLFWLESFEKAKSLEEKGALTYAFCHKSALISNEFYSVVQKEINKKQALTLAVQKFYKEIQSALNQVNIQLSETNQTFTEVERRQKPELIHLAYKRAEKAYAGFFEQVFAALKALKLSFDAC